MPCSHRLPEIRLPPPVDTAPRYQDPAAATRAGPDRPTSLTAAWGRTDQKLRGYEEDNCVRLQVGSAPSDGMNLWPEPYHATWNTNIKGKLKRFASKQTCSGKWTIARRHAIFTGSWVTELKNTPWEEVNGELSCCPPLPAPRYDVQRALVMSSKIWNKL